MKIQIKVPSCITSKTKADYYVRLMTARIQMKNLGKDTQYIDHELNKIVAQTKTGNKDLKLSEKYERDSKKTLPRQINLKSKKSDTRLDVDPNELDSVAKDILKTYRLE